MDANHRPEQKDEDRGATGPGSDTVDPAPLLGQVGEGATLESGEAIARAFRELTEGSGASSEENTDERASASADPEMPIPSPDRTE